MAMRHIRIDIFMEYRAKRRRETNRSHDRSVSPSLRHAVLKRDNKRCVKCGASPSRDPSVRLEVDHIIPVARGGSSSAENLQTLCWECNQGKKDRDD